MTLMASRIERDEDDIRLLLGLCGISTADEALDVLHDLYGSRPIAPKVQDLVAELLDAPQRSGAAAAILDAETMPAPDLVDLRHELDDRRGPFS